MSSRQTSGSDQPGRRREELIARRAEQRRRRLRRRRLGAAAAALVIVAGLAAVLAAHFAAGTSSAGVAGSVRTSHAGWKPHIGPVPILECHVLGPVPAGAPYPELWVSRPDFHREMDWLGGHGYQAVTLEEVEDAWYHGATLPPKPVVISFDDGYRPQFTYALPELLRHGWAGVLNLKAEASDLYHSNVRAMIDAGWELAAHTIHHSDLTTLDGAALKEEVAGSRAILRREYGVPVENFCYPAGRFDQRVVAAVEAAGYAGATTEVRGYASRDAPYELDRFEILGSSGVAGLATDLRSGS
jgi:peptidoglycan/xylan/chitin deacetylase (PgdA/CDA1 family)